MEIESTALYQEIMSIINDGPKPVNNYYKAYFIIDDKKYEPLKILDISSDRNYVTEKTDIRFITLVIPAGLWSKVIYPKLNILDISVVKIPLQEISEEGMPDEEIEEIRYTAIPIPSTVPNLTGDSIQRMSIAAIDTAMGYFNVQFQLVEKGFEAMKMVTVGAVFRRTTTEDVTKGVLAKERRKVKTISGYGVKTIDMIKSDNEEKREHIFLPQGLRYLDVPEYIQQNCGGIYNSGINIFFQNRGLFVYPPFDTTRYRSAPIKATILKIPKQRYTELERTYREEGDVVFIAGTSDAKFEDQSFIKSRNIGDGVRYGDSRFTMRDITEIKDNKSKIVRKDINTEFVSKSKSDQPNYRQQLYVPLSREHINSNPFFQRSRLAHVNGAIYQIDWQNSNPDLLIPGMMVKIIYMSKDEFKELYGVLTQVASTTQLKGEGLTSQKHITNSALFVFTTMLTDEEQDFDDIDQQTIEAWENYEMG